MSFLADYSNHLDSTMQIKLRGGGGVFKDLKNQCVSQLFSFRPNALGGLLESLSVLEIVRNR